jgi:hypothetical protein
MGEAAVTQFLSLLILCFVLFWVMEAVLKREAYKNEKKEKGKRTALFSNFGRELVSQQSRRVSSFWDTSMKRYVPYSTISTD